MKFEYRDCKICSIEYIERYDPEVGLAKVPICGRCEDKASWKTYRVRIPIMGYYEDEHLAGSPEKAVEMCQENIVFGRDFSPTIISEGDPEVEVVEGYNPYKYDYDEVREGDGNNDR